MKFLTSLCVAHGNLLYHTLHIAPTTLLVRLLCQESFERKNSELLTFFSCYVLPFCVRSFFKEIIHVGTWRSCNVKVKAGILQIWISGKTLYKINPMWDLYSSTTLTSPVYNIMSSSLANMDPWDNCWGILKVWWAAYTHQSGSSGRLRAASAGVRLQCAF